MREDYLFRGWDQRENDRPSKKGKWISHFYHEVEIWGFSITFIWASISLKVWKGGFAGGPAGGGHDDNRQTAVFQITSSRNKSLKKYSLARPVMSCKISQNYCHRIPLGKPRFLMLGYDTVYS